jgi:predicted nucleotidyltransferase
MVAVKPGPTDVCRARVPGRQTRTRVQSQRMRLTVQQADTIKRLACEIAGPNACVRLFGSRLDDTARGGDVDLLVELPEPVDNPALLAARLSARISRALDGRGVDVLLSAPNLARLPIHDIAFRQGRPL